MASNLPQQSPSPAQTAEQTILQLGLELGAARTQAKKDIAALADADSEISMLHQAERGEQERQIGRVDVEREFMETIIRELREEVEKLKMEKGVLEAENTGLKKKLEGLEGAAPDLKAGRLMTPGSEDGVCAT
ncbi:hypothetical protein LTR27_011383 [Elasticomyces elasticus]|nr:hypothetical protein LTR27_011383 [Elasticomyces elasticus]